MNWELFWKITFIIILALFSVMSVVVTILGARDITRLFAALKADSEKTTNNTDDAE